MSVSALNRVPPADPRASLLRVGGGRSGGFTLIELLVAIPLCGLLLLLAMAELRSVVRSSGRASRGAIEAIAAAEFAERFRNDVRAAQRIVVAPAGDEVTLHGVSGATKYERRGDGRIERTGAGSDGSTMRGPVVYAARFVLEEGSGLRLLRARLVCASDDDGPAPRNNVHRTGRMLVLDTALRAALQREEKP